MLKQSPYISNETQRIIINSRSIAGRALPAAGGIVPKNSDLPYSSHSKMLSVDSRLNQIEASIMSKRNNNTYDSAQIDIESNKSSE